MTVAVIIAAWNAERTIVRAVRSALTQAEVSEVVVVDDASPDGTAAAALAADDGSGRLRVLRQPSNLGPSAARNRALEASRADLVAVLDADDYFLPGRFAALLAVPGWDAIADNIAFIAEDRDAERPTPPIVAFSAPPRPLSLGELLTGSISRRGYERGELGFLKPVIRRDFLDAHRLRYDESLRLGEDFVLYARMLGAGARFLTVRQCGYVAVERAGSLSGSHRTADLAALLGAVDRWANYTSIAPSERAALGRYRAQLSANYRHRRLLDDKRDRGFVAAVRGLLDEPATVARVAGRVARDKLAPRRGPPPPSPGVRYLLNR